MKKCKSDACENSVAEKRVYCSRSCRTRTTNKLYKNYEQRSQIVRQKTREAYQDRFCVSCGEVIPYEKRNHNGKFCSRSCSVAVTNTYRETGPRKFSPQAIENIRIAAAKRVGQKIRHVIHCPICGTEFYQKRKFCSKRCLIKSRQNKLKDLKVYRQNCVFTFNLNEYPDKFNFDLIKIHGWYSPSNKKNNLTGVSRDHIFSVRNGFDLGVAPEIMSHPANCQLLVHSQNVSKHKKSLITYEQLIERISKWEG